MKTEQKVKLQPCAGIALIKWIFLYFVLILGTIGHVYAQTCAEDITGVNLNCTAKEIGVEYDPVVLQGAQCCSLGEEITVDIGLNLFANTNRYDVAIYNAEDGGDALTGQCFRQEFSTTDSPFSDLEGTLGDGNDSCGDISSAAVNGNNGDPFAYDVSHTTTITCDGTIGGPVEVGAVYLWTQNNDDTVCDYGAGTGSKCRTYTYELDITVLDPSIDLTKTGTPNFGADGIAQAGETITYSFIVENTGNQPLIDVKVNDPLLGGDICNIGSLVVGATDSSCTADYIITQSDIDNAPTTINNTATASGQVDSPAQCGTTVVIVEDTDNEVINVPQHPNLTITKEADVASVSADGDVINYTITVTNTGNTTLTNVVVSDPLLGTLTGPGGDTDNDGELDVGEVWTYTGSYTVQQSDIDSNGIDDQGVADGDGDIDNTATVDTDQTDPDEALAAVPLSNAPSLTITKEADVASVSADGDVINYTITVTNTGNTTLTNVVASDPLLGTLTGPGGDTNNNGDLDIGEVWTYTGSYTVQQSDIDSNGIDDQGVADGDGDIDNTVTVDTDQTNPNSAVEVVDIIQSPNLTIAKEADVASVSADGDVINYTITVTNTGNTTLTNVVVSDPLLGTLTGPSGDTDNDGELDVGEVWTYTGSYTVQQSDIDSNGIDDQGVADGDGDIDNTVTVDTDQTNPNSAVEVVDIIQSPNLTIAKEADVASVSADGDVINYTITVTNTGNTTLTNVVVSDPLLGTLTGPSGDTDNDGELDVGEVWTYTGSYTVQQSDIDSNGIDDQGVADGDGDIDNTVTVDTDQTNPNSAVEVVDIIQSPNLTIAKEADVASVSADGDVINYTITVTNTGNTTLTNVVVSDPLLGTLTGPSGDTDNDGELDVGEVWTYTGSYTVQQSDIDSNGIDDQGVADGDGDIDNTVTVDTDQTNPNSAVEVVDIIQSPNLTIAKEADVASVSADGDVINYTITVTNTGNTTLTNVVVSDPLLGTLTGPSGDTDNDGELDVGEVWTYTGSYTVQQSDIDSNGIDDQGVADGDGDIDNTATVNTDQTDPSNALAAVPLSNAPSLTIVKEADVASVSADGDVINYTITVTNTGNTTLTNVVVSDPLLGTLTGPSGDTDNDGELDVGEVWTYTGSYTVQQSDIDSNGIDDQGVADGDGDIDNTVTVDTDQTNPNSAVEVVDIIQSPNLTIAKEADVASVSADGDVINYTITVTNTGNTTLTNVVVSDPLLGTLTGPSGDTDNDGELDVGEVWTYTGSYTVQQSDIDSNGIDDQGVADGDGDIDNTVTVDTDQTNPNSAVEVVDIIQSPNLTIAKEADVASVSADGDVINYTITVTNTGNTTLTNVVVSDPLLGTLTGPSGDTDNDGELDVGEVWTYTGSYTVQQSDIDSNGIDDQGVADGDGDIDNTATVNTDQTDPSNALAAVPLSNAPSLTIVKEADVASVSADGDVINYTITVTNTGNTTLTNVVVSDPLLGTLTGPSGDTDNDGELDVGEVWTYTGSYTVQQSDIDSNGIDDQGVADGDGDIDNTVTVDTDQTNPNSAVEVVDIIQSPNLTIAKEADVASVSADGDVINYTITVTNTGNTTLTNVVVSDPLLGTLTGPSGDTDNDGELDVGEVWTYTGSYTVQQSDIDSNGIDDQGVADGDGDIDNTVTVDTDQTNPNSAVEVVDIIQSPNLTIAKEADVASVSADGDVINYTITVTNTGNTTLTNVVVSDPLLGTLTGPSGDTDNDGELDVGEVWTYTGSYTVQQSDIDSNGIDDQGVADGDGDIDNTVTVDTDQTNPNSAVEVVDIIQSPNLTIAKEADVASVSADGDVINYTITVTNTGNTTLTNVVVSDPLLGTLTGPSGDTDNDGELDVGEVWTYTGSYTVQQSDIDSNGIDDQGVADGDGDIDNTVTVDTDQTNPNSAVEVVDIIQSPNLTIAKEADVASVSADGDVINYTITVTNTGNTTLTNVVVSDPLLGTLTGPSGDTDNDGELDVGEVWTYTGSYTVQQSDIDSNGIDDQGVADGDGDIDNTATACGEAPSGDTNTLDDDICDTGSENVLLGQSPAISLDKSANPTSYNEVGDVIDYEYLVTNTGNVTLTGPVTVADDKATVTCPDLTTIGNGDSDFQPNEEITCTASYTITQADLDNGFVTNTATASVDQIESEPDSETVDAVTGPAVNLDKSANPTSYNAVGDIIDYEYLVTNTGNVTLAGPVTVTDDKATVTCPDLTTIGNGDSDFQPNESITCTASYTITQADLDNGFVTNVATATVGEIDSNEDTETVDAVTEPVVSLDKSANPTSYNEVGDIIDYEYLVTNTGNVTLAGPVTVTDDKATVTCPDLTTIGNGDSDFQPNESITCTASYTITQADLDNGFVTNVATATVGEIDSNEDTETVDAVTEPVVSLDKSANPTSYNAVGDIIDYEYLVTNTGNVTLAGPVTVTDDKATVTCPDLTTIGNGDSDFQPNEEITCTASYTITQADLDNGFVTNVATATVGQVDSNEDTETVDAVTEPVVNLDKSANPTSYNAVGDIIDYEYLVTNTGNVTLAGPVTVTDDKATVTCPDLTTIGNGDSDFQPNESITCTASYTITQADLDNGFVTNVATATVGEIDSNEDTETVDAVTEPAVSLDKSANPTSYNEVGDIIDYEYLVTNTGNVTLAGPVTVTDDKATVTCPDLTTIGNGDSDFQPNESITCTASYTITQADLDNGFVTNTATASVDQIESEPDSETVDAVTEPAVSLDKSANPTSYNAVGDIIDYEYLVTNTGNVTLAGPVTVTDDKATVTCPDLTTIGNGDSDFQPNESITCTASYTITQADLDNGFVTNVATATVGEIDSNEDTETVDAVTGPAVSLDKSANPTSYNAVGDIIDYEYLVTNTGNVTLAGPVTVTDDKATVTCPDLTTIGNGDSDFQPNESITCTASYTITQADLDNGFVTNVATATVGEIDSNEDTETVDAVTGPAVSLDKSANPTSYNAVGDIIDYEYLVTNTGNVTLAGPVTVTDDKATVTCPDLTTIGNGDSDFQPNESITCTASYTITQADLDNGFVTNVATATVGEIDSNEDTETVDAVTGPAVSLDKSANPTSYNAVGDIIDYEYLVTNTGNVTLAGPVTVTDDKATVTCPDLTTIGNGDSDFQPNESITCTASYTITQADLDNGFVTNVATATVGEIDSNEDTETVDAVTGPAVSLDKSANPTSYNAVGDIIDYEYLVTNTGNVTLAGPVTVTDDKATVTCPDLTTIGNGDSDFQPNEEITCTASYTITQADLDNGFVTNVATATVGEIDSNEDTETVDAVTEPVVSLDKSANPTSYNEVGDIIDYEYLVTNTGNVTLAGPVTVTDDKATVTCPDLTTIGNGDSDFQPNESITCTASYTITQADLDNGFVTNVATATVGEIDSNEDTETVDAVTGPAVSLDKSANPTSYNAVGDIIDYEYLVTNTGNVTLAGPVTVTDDKATVTCPDLTTIGNGDSDFQPNEEITCTASYTITQADLDNGFVTNTATASVDQIESEPDSETVDAVTEPAVSLDKSANPTSYNEVGDIIDYEYLVTNTGNVTLAGPVTVTDDKATVTCPDLTTIGNGDSDFQPNEEITCTASYTITQADLDNGSVTNTASASVDGTESEPDSETVDAVTGPAVSLDKSANPTSYNAVGDIIDYEYLVTNTGNVTLAGPVTVTDDKATVTCPDLTTIGNGDSDFQPNESITCTASYTITQADLDNGSVTNTASASVDGTESEPDSETVDAVTGPAVSLAKSANPTSYNAVGDIIDYEYLVTNTGNVTLAGPVTVADDKATVTCPDLTTIGNGDSDFQPNESITCTASYTITQADLDNGSVTNTASASVDGTESEPDSETVDAVTGPAVSLAKSANPTSYNAVGDIIDYEYLVTNTGNVTLAGPVTVADDKATVTCPDLTTIGNGDSDFQPNESITCTASYTITQADLDNGSVTNTASASVDGTESEPDSETVDAVTGPAVSLDKSANPTSYNAVGDIIDYEYLVTNTGNVTLTGPVTVADDKATVTCPDLTTIGNGDSDFQPNESITCTASYTITQADLDNGFVTNTATASVDQIESEPDSETVDAVTEPAVSLDKSANPTSYNEVGDIIDYEYLVTNTGNVTLAGPVTVTDDKATVTCPDLTTIGNGDSDFQPNESITCTASYTITQADLDNGFVTNVATATVGEIDSNEDTETVDAVTGPAVSLDKSANPTSYNAVGDIIDYEYLVTNTGNVTLAGPVTVTDDKATVTCPDLTTIGNGDSDFQPNESITCTASYTITQADLDNGFVTNVATATVGEIDSNEDTETVDAVTGPAVSLDKSANPTSYNAVGDIIDYEYLVTNTGNVTLAGPVTVTDDKATVTCPDLTTIGNGDSDFQPNESITCTASYTITQADLDNGFVTNVATATVGEIDSNEDTETVDAVTGPAVSLDKSANPTSYNAVGDIIDYEYLVTNTGNVTLAGPVTVTDDKATVTCPDLTTIGNGDSDFQPNEEITCTASYTITQADLDNGFVTNVATATVGEIDSNEDTETVDAVTEPVVSLDKSANPTSYNEVGDIIDYEYLVTNTGNVTLAGPVTVTDDKATVTCPDLTTIGNGDSDFQPNESITCTASYTITQADLDNGFVTNVATATVGEIDSNEDTETVDAVTGPAVSLDKSANPTSYNAVGDIIDYEYLVTNTGNVTLAGPVTVTDDKATVTCPDLTTIGNGDSDFQPNEEITCTASYTITQADLDNGFVTNTATASVDQIESEPDSETVDAVTEPAVSLDKSANPTSYNEVGDIIDYEYLVTNTGNVTLAGPVTVTDDKATVTCPDLTTIGNGDSDFQPNESITCTASYTITQADLDNGSVTNTASASVDGTESEPDSETVDAVTGPAVSLAKSANPTSYNAVGDVIDYEYLVTNTGNVTLAGPVTVTDDKATVTCPDLTTIGNGDSDFQPNESITCTASYTITQADLDNGSVTNTASASVDGTESEPDSETVDAVTGPAISVDKELTGNADEDGSGTVTLNDTLTYEITATNTGNVTLNNVVVSDDLTGDITSCATLTPGANCELVVSYIVTQADVDAGKINNIGTADSDETDPVEDPEEVPIAEEPGLSVDKVFTGNQDEDVSGIISVGDTLDYTITATNTGNITLHNVVVSDDLTGDSTSCATLAPSDTCILTVTYVVTQVDVDTGFIENVGTADSDETDPVEDPEEVLIAEEPGLSVDKVFTGNEDEDGSRTINLGDTLNYTITATNTGNITLHNVVVSDDLTGDSTNCATLAPSDTCVLTVTYVVTQADVDAGEINNIGTADSDETLETEDPENVPIDEELGLSVDKVFTSNQDEDTSGTISLGDTLNYSITATNTGNVTLNNVVVSDDLTGDSTSCATLAPDSTCVLLVTYQVQPSDVEAGSIINTGTVDSDETDPVDDTEEVPVVQNPGLEIDKVLTNNADEDGSGNVSLGDTLTYTITATNTGDVILSNVVVSDDLMGDSNTCATLVPGSTCVLVATYQVQPSDVEAGSIINTGTVDSNETDPVDDTEEVPVVQNPELEVDKVLTNNADEDSSGNVSLGDTLTYTITATNTGDVILSNVVVSDDLTDDSNTCAILAPGNTCTLVIVYVVTQADVDAGQVTNTGVADSNETEPVNDSEVVDILQEPALGIDKVLTSNADEDGSGAISLGDTLTYTITATNIGNITLDNVTVSDSLIANLTCSPTTPATLAPEEQVICTGTYVVTEDDVTEGTIDNIGTATSDQTDFVIDTETVDVVQEPSLLLAKEVVNLDPDNPVQFGSAVDYKITIINDGLIDVVADVIDLPSVYLSYVTNSAVITVGAEATAVEPEIVTVDDVTGEKQLIWRSIEFPKGQTVTITYQMTVALFIPEEDRGKLTNIVTVRDLEDDAEVEPVVITVSADDITTFRLTENILTGRVYLDADDDGSYDPDEDIPLPGARIVLSNGWQTITDVEGNYAFRGVPTGTASVKLDASTAPYLPRDNHEGIDEGYLHQVSMFGVTISDFPLVVPEGLISVERRTTVMFGPITLEKHHVPLPEGVRVVLHITSSEVLPARIRLVDPVPGGETKVFEFERVIDEQTLTYDVPIEIPMTDPTFEWGNQ